MTMTWLRFISGTVFACGLISRAALLAADFTIPRNIIVDPSLQSIVADMIDRSPSFRDLCRDLGKIPSLRVRVMLALPSDEASRRWRCRAECVLNKHEYGGISAVIRLPSRHHAVELIAHELEHVREYTEGINYRLMAALPRANVWRSASGHYETRRAEDMGLRVAEEVRPRVVEINARRDQ